MSEKSKRVFIQGEIARDTRLTDDHKHMIQSILLDAVGKAEGAKSA